MLEPLLGFTVTTVTALGGALGTVRGWGTAFMSSQQHTHGEHNKYKTKFEKGIKARR